MRPGSSQKVLRVGTRRSLLAKAQTQWVIDRISQMHPELQIEVVEIVTTGDRVLDRSLTVMAGKGVFVKEIEEKLLAGEIDLAVHSMKDLPTDAVPGLVVGVIPERADPRDVLVTRLSQDLEALPKDAKIGTGSLRRKAQLLRLRPDLHVVDIRGNIDTRLKKAETDTFDGIILAAAGLARLGWLHRVQQFLNCEQMVPAVGQGALGIETREDDEATRALLAPLNHPETETAVKAERVFLARMGGGCQTPMAAFCRVQNDRVVLQGFCADENGERGFRDQVEGSVAEAADLAARLADRLLEKSQGRE
ncbi:MAG: hydroxymethylbilane synthase [Calditrichaeota bacterium]|nr:MAG: hydroxymethylbilane synthase [Calditrichota bacterium]